MASNKAGIVENVVIGAERNQKDYYDGASHYDTVWGQDNIHLGYYPHLVGPVGGDNLVVLNNKQAADCLTKRMIDVGASQICTVCLWPWRSVLLPHTLFWALHRAMKQFLLTLHTPSFVPGTSAMV